MDRETREALSRRLAAVAGHLKGIEHLVQHDAPCLHAIRQVRAAQVALHQVSLIALHDCLHTCLRMTTRAADGQDVERDLRDIANLFTVSSKWNLSARRQGPLYRQTFAVPNISCSHCVHTIETETDAIVDVAHVNAYQETRQVTVARESPASGMQSEATLQEINYPAEGVIPAE